MFPESQASVGSPGGAGPARAGLNPIGWGQGKGSDRAQAEMGAVRALIPRARVSEAQPDSRTLRSAVADSGLGSEEPLVTRRTEAVELALPLEARGLRLRGAAGLAVPTPAADGIVGGTLRASGELGTAVRARAIFDAIADVRKAPTVRGPVSGAPALPLGRAVPSTRGITSASTRQGVAAVGAGGVLVHTGNGSSKLGTDPRAAPFHPRESSVRATAPFLPQTLLLTSSRSH